MDQMAVISKAGYGLLQFVNAILGYCAVYRIVRPKQERVMMLEREFAKVKYFNYIHYPPFIWYLR